MQAALLVALLSAAAFVVAAEEISSNIQPVVGQQQPQQHQGPLVPVQVHSVAPVGEQQSQPQIVHHVAHQPAVSGEQQQQHHAHDGHPHHAHEGHYAQDGHTHDHPGQQLAQPQFVPSGLIQVVGPQQYSGAASVGVSPSSSGSSVVGGPVASSEQYGKPESASIPPNYKPFGSWGLYIGGNPADGYYSNYYKALGSSVADKQQVGGVSDKQVGSQVSAFGPILKQASSYPYAVGGASYADQVYPFDYYTPADLNSGSRVAVFDQSSGPSSYSAGGPISSPVSIGSQVYGAPLASVYNQPGLVYADAYSTKRLGSLTPAKGHERAVQQQQQQQQVELPSKGYQQQQHHQQQQQHHYMQSPVHYQQSHHYAAGQGPQVVAYPVPVGSQIVGSQPGTDGAYAPYGVHGYTRYAVKPTVVASSEQQYYHQGVHSAPIAHFPVYKQQVVAAHSANAYQPLGFYGYPLNQLHYSQGSIVPSYKQHGASTTSFEGSVSEGEHSVSGNHGIAMAPAGAIVEGAIVGEPSVVAASSEKSETHSTHTGRSAVVDSKPVAAKEQKNTN